MEKFRRGFKKECNEIVDELRSELGIGTHDQLDPLALATHLAIDVVELSALHSATRAAVDHLLGEGQSEFSAATVFYGYKKIILINPAHAPVRRASNITHELSHVILEHEPDQSIRNGSRLWDARMEREADWLSGCLLVPHEAALQVERVGTSVDEAAAHFGVSTAMMEWRLNHSGARVRVKREKAAHGRRFG